MRTEELDVVIVTYNSSEVLQGLLDSLMVALEGVPRARVIVADNASEDGSDQIAAAHPICAKVVPIGYNAGYSAGINAAVLQFPGKGPILLLNADIRLRPDCVEAMLEGLAKPNVGVLAPKILHEDGTLAYSIRREPSLITAWSEALLGGKLAGKLGIGEIDRRPSSYDGERPIMLASGAILMVSREVWNRVGGWDERYFLYSEEVDYQRRARLAGFELRFSSEAVCTHIGGESNVNPRLFALLTANRIRDYRRHHGAFETALLRLAIAAWAAPRCVLGTVYRAAFQAVWMSLPEVARLVPSPRAVATLLSKP